MALAESHIPVPSVKSLVDLLQQEILIYREMASVLEEERGAMLAMDFERLSEIVPRKETLALRIKALDESRKMVSNRLALQYRIPVNELTISRLCDALDPSTARQLSMVRDELKAVVCRCQGLNEHNERAARVGMELVHGAMEFMIKEADPAGQLYKAPKGAARGYRPAAAAVNSGLLSQQA